MYSTYFLGGSHAPFAAFRKKVRAAPTVRSARPKHRKAQTAFYSTRLIPDLESLSGKRTGPPTSLSHERNGRGRRSRPARPRRLSESWRTPPGLTRLS